MNGVIWRCMSPNTNICWTWPTHNSGNSFFFFFFFFFLQRICRPKTMCFKKIQHGQWTSPSQHMIRLNKLQWNGLRIEEARSGGFLETGHYQRQRAKYTLLATDKVNSWEMIVKYSPTALAMNYDTIASLQNEPVVESIFGKTISHPNFTL